MQGDLQILDPERPRPAGRELRDASGERDGLGHDALGVVVALQQEQRNAGPVQPRHLAVEEQADRRIAPLAVIDIAGDDDEGDLRLDRPGDEIGEGLAARRGEAPGHLRVLEAEAGQRAAEVQIGRVQECESHLSTLGPDTAA
jgi:hypothetical protein